MFQNNLVLADTVLADIVLADIVLADFVLTDVVLAKILFDLHDINHNIFSVLPSI